MLEYLGGIAIVSPHSTSLTPPQSECVEVGPVRVIGGVHRQKLGASSRPDGVRFAFDSKTLNDRRRSVGKNSQEMINDLATEATTVHSRFPHAVVAFMVICPAPCVSMCHRKATIKTFSEPLTRRSNVDGPLYMAEAISLILWHPNNGTIDADIPLSSSPLESKSFPNR